MNKKNVREILLNFTIILIIFFTDRISKTYILDIAEINNSVDIYINSYLNLYLIWNRGIAFGLFSFDHNIIYNIVTSIIAAITLVILILILKSKGAKRYILLVVFGGALGNLFDRIYYSAVPDFIDLHVKEFHWFVFNVADIFITVGIICLIFVELFYNKKANDK